MRSPAARQLPLLGSNQDSPDPVPLRLSPPLECAERSWSGLCLHLRRYAVRWLPPSLYTFPFRGLGSASPVKGSPTSRAFAHAVSDAPSSGAPFGAARVRRVASYTKGQCAIALRPFYPTRLDRSTVRRLS